MTMGEVYGKNQHETGVTAAQQLSELYEHDVEYDESRLSGVTRG